MVWVPEQLVEVLVEQVIASLSDDLIQGKAKQVEPGNVAR